MIKILRSTLDFKLFLNLLLIVSPWLILIGFSLISGHFITESIPVWSDELSYWHEIFSLSQKGFHHGYYTYNEIIPSISNFGPHGLGTVSVYTLFAKFFGWKSYSMIIANAFFISIAFCILVIIVKPASKVITFIFLFTITYTPYLLFSITSMSEGLNYALVIVYFSLLHILIQHKRKTVFILLLVVCTYFSIIRIIYILFFLPLLFVLKKEYKFDSKLFLYFGFWILFSVILFIFSSWFVSPYPDSFLNELFKVNGLNQKISLFTAHFVANLKNFVNPFSDDILQVLERYFVFIVLIYSFIKSKLLRTKFKRIEIRYFVVFLILFSVFLITVAAYDVFDWRDYRVLAPVLYGSILFLMLNSNPYNFYSSLAINCIIFVFLIISPALTKFLNEKRFEKPKVNEILNRIEYTTNEKSTFENTIAVKSFTQHIVLNVPAGIGISTVDSFSDNLHSKYIFSEIILTLKTYQLIDYNGIGYLYSKKIN